MSMFSISDHGVRIQRSAPTHALDDVAARRRAVLRALEVLQPVVRPLALEIVLGPLHLDTFAVEPSETRRLAVRTIPAGVAHPSTFTPPVAVELVDALTPDTVLRAITPPQANWDIASVTATVTAARVASDELVFDQLPTQRMPVIELDGAPWVVGPLDEPGYRLTPPIALIWKQAWGDLRLTVESAWSLWWPTESAERAGLRAVERALDAAGFTIEH
jgi:hypothetical protein